MRKLQFIAKCTNHHDEQPANRSRITQEYVAALLFKQLGEYGFDAQHIAHEHEKVEVNIENHQLPLSVTCTQKNDEGHMMCEITANPKEEQDWFEKIETQSVIRQLAQAVENSLKSDQTFTAFEWKN
ncbi:hypothetical protein [Acinetobacter ihumii]|uniref:hypothetical protein n=1 Tax=Acinetobacter ihumii TaxID=2483802 RepID=UPI00102FAF46|nr:hypothetical protein [Acinetobacter ihumii]